MQSCSDQDVYALANSEKDRLRSLNRFLSFDRSAITVAGKNDHGVSGDKMRVRPLDLGQQSRERTRLLQS